MSEQTPKEARSIFAADCVQHNPYLPPSMDPLLEAIAAVQSGSSEQIKDSAGLEIKNVVAEGNLVGVHVNLRSKSDKAKGMRQIHLFRFDDSGDKIVEYWDVTQMAPENAPTAFRMY